MEHKTDDGCSKRRKCEEYFAPIILTNVASRFKSTSWDFSAALRCLELFETQDGSATEILKNHILEMLEVTLDRFVWLLLQSKDAAEDAWRVYRDW